jgi:4-hydroxy-2-oxoheptanedioate aldolase
MRPNKLREKLDAGEPTVSTHIHSTWPSIIEAIALTGVYDYIEFVAEYGPYDLHDFDNMCRAAEVHGVGMMCKVDQNEQAFVAQRAIGSGFGSILFTDIRSATDVLAAKKAINPDIPGVGGTYGVATRRITYMGYGGSQDYVDTLKNIVFTIMIEKKPTLENLDEILDVPGIDMIQWGPADFSMSSGYIGQRNHPDVIKARNRVYKAAADRGIAARAEIQSVDQAKEFLDMGVRHFSLGTDISIIHNWLKTNGEALRRAMDGE